MSFVLRHEPEAIGLVLDDHGWADVSDLIAKMKAAGQEIDRSILNEIVASNDKKRFALSDNNAKIRASQGHSLKSVDLKLKSVVPPDLLYHGTAVKNSEAIHLEGLLKMGRNHVHLSATVNTAVKVGSRHGQPLVFRIDAKRMHEDGYPFYLSENKVWLTDYVPAKYIIF